MLYVDLNPNSNIPFAAPQNKWNIFKYFFKFVVILLFMIDRDGNYTTYYQVSMTFVYGAQLSMKFRTTTFYNRTIEVFTSICDVTLFWVTLCGLVKIIINDSDSDIGLVYLLFEIPFVSYTFLKLLDYKKDVMLRNSLKNLSKDEDVECYINTMRTLIELREKDYYRIKLEGLLKYHQKYCHKGDKCPCNDLTYDF